MYLKSVLLNHVCILTATFLKPITSRLLIMNYEYHLFGTHFLHNSAEVSLFDMHSFLDLPLAV